jgi:hypothetical protein
MTPQERDKRLTRRLDVAILAIGGILVAAAVFQFFLRYTYVHTTNQTIVRIDRLTGDSCTVPCSDPNIERAVAFADARPTSPPEKACHDADVVRVARTFVPPPKKLPATYRQGGFPRVLARHYWSSNQVPRAVELSDGHVYAFTPQAFASDVADWLTGQSVQVCATWSKLEARPYYSVGAGDAPSPAVLAL